MKGSFLFVAWFWLSAFYSQAVDVVSLKGGAKKLCQVVGLETGNIIILSQPVPELPPIELRYSQNQVSSIEFGHSPYLETLLRESTVAKVEELQSFWNRYAPLLGFAGSPSARIGLRLGMIYLEGRDNQLLKKAFEIFSRVTDETSDLSEREAAQQGKLRVWIALGQSSDAILEARRILARPSGPNLCAEARVILADAMSRELDQFLEDNPRWEEDKAAGKERTRLYHDGLELYLLASLLPEIAPHIAARGLWGAMALHVKCNAPWLAAENARDLIAIFPDTAFAGKAADFLSTLPPETQNTTETPFRQPIVHPLQGAAPDNTYHETKNPTVSSEGTLDNSGGRTKRNKRKWNRNQ